jgi:hypothetical protein
MQAIPIRTFLALVILVSLCPSSLSSATEQRTALVIGNSTYSSGPLKNPVNDATDMATALQKLGFKVILKKNANLETMEEAIEDFGNRLKRGGVGLFYYAGHGVQVNGVNFLIPVGAKVNKESDVRYKAVDAGRILDEMANANNSLNIVLLDACRDNPFGKSFRSASRGLAIVSNAPTGTFISYSTGPGQVARDGEGRNSPYTRALLQYMQEPGIPIGNVFMKVRQKLRKDTGQVPWELSSLEGDFYFISGPVSEAATGRDESPPSGKTTIIALKDMQQQPEEYRKKYEEGKAKIEAVEDELRQLKLQLNSYKGEILRQKGREYDQKWESYKKLVQDTNKELDSMKSNLAMSNRPESPTARETGRDGRFIAYSDGTVLDTKTNLMWAAKDNGAKSNWQSAKNYCENYRGGGYTDWRMPTQDELVGLYDEGKGYTPVCAAKGDNEKVYLTNLINLGCWFGWASETNGSNAALFDFRLGHRDWYSQLTDYSHRALPVRSAK